MGCKRGQTAGSAAAFVAIITVLIILYILFLPPDIRTELLGDSNPSGTNGNSDNANTQVLLQQNVGTVTYINTNEKTYDIPTTRIYSPTSGQVLKNVPSVMLRYALFDHEKSSYDMDVALDRAATTNVLLSFNVKDYQGPLTIKLNGKEIFSGEIDSNSPKPILLDHSSLLDSNTVTFSVPSPGWAFWKVNKYTIENIQVTGDVTDYTNALAKQNFVISQSEKDNLEKVTLFFYPYCDLKSVGSLEIDLNGGKIYDSVADCGTRTFAELNVNDIVAGSNELRFYSSKGSYTLDNMNIQTEMKKPAYKTYYFDMKKEQFTIKNDNPRCGDVDGQCPAGCDETQDADCCFKRSGFWCALPTLNANDRCRFYVSSDDCSICKTGFYDMSGDAPDACKNTCGDNNDGKCVSGCSQPTKYYDKDCCFAENTANFWCKETPITGISDKCKPSVAPGECDLCPSGYIDENGAEPKSCTDEKSIAFDTGDEILLSNYEVKLTVEFVQADVQKRVDFNINGHTFRIDTTGIEYTKIINDYVRSGTNSIEIVPVDDDVDISEVKVELRKIV